MFLVLFYCLQRTMPQVRAPVSSTSMPRSASSAVCRAGGSHSANRAAANLHMMQRPDLSPQSQTTTRGFASSLRSATNQSDPFADGQHWCCTRRLDTIGTASCADSPLQCCGADARVGAQAGGRYRCQQSGKGADKSSDECNARLCSAAVSTPE